MSLKPPAKVAYFVVVVYFVFEQLAESVFEIAANQNKLFIIVGIIIRSAPI